MAVYNLTSPVTNDSPGNDIKLSVSVFFDGTQNNMYNTEAKVEYQKKLAFDKMTFVYPTGTTFDRAKEAAKYYDVKLAGYYQKMSNKTDDSYENDYSNVVRLFKYYTNEYKATYISESLYVEGIATGDIYRSDKSYANTSPTSQDYQEDSVALGLSIGKGGTGIEPKVKKACRMLAAKIQGMASGENKISSLTVDVFGFSRGAAAARLFIHEITQQGKAAYTTNTYMQVGYVPGGYYVPVQIPAVPAYGLLGETLNQHGITIGKIHVNFAGLFDTVASHGVVKSDDVKDLHLEAVNKATHMLHITAIDERRYFFPLIKVKNTGASKKEKAFPGVHSDIGGSYTDYMNEDRAARFTLVHSLEEEKSKLVQDGWYKENELTVRAQFFLDGRRKGIRNSYSYIPLQIMCRYATEEPIYITFKKENLMVKYRIPTDLLTIHKRLEAYVFDETHTVPEMKFYTRKELNAKIEAIRPPKEEPQEVYNRYLQKMEPVTAMSTHVVVKPVPNIQMPLNPEEFNQYPELKRHIEDHNLLLKIRHGYLHLSSNCLKTGMQSTFSGKRETYLG